MSTFKYRPRVSPELDGIDFINVYSQGKTELGRALSNFAPIPLTHEKWGTFQSMEACWYWLATNKIHDELRPLHGLAAKKLGRTFNRVEYPEFKNDVEHAIYLKISQNPQLLSDFIQSTLPFQHFFVYSNGGDSRVIFGDTSVWLSYYLNNLRDKLKGKVKRGIRLGVVGSRTITDYQLVCESIIDLNLHISEIVSGGAKGVDYLAEQYADERNIPKKIFKPDWTLGKQAGFLRNSDIVEYSDSILALYNGISKGTADTIQKTKEAGKTLYIIRTDLLDTSSMDTSSNA